MRKIKIITNTGYKYSGELIEKNENFIVLIDVKEGEISIPLINISMIKDISNSSFQTNEPVDSGSFQSSENKKEKTLENGN